MPGTYQRLGADELLNQYSRFRAPNDEIAAVYKYDLDGNMREDSPYCRGDFNGDHAVTTHDLTMLLSSFGQMVPPGSPGDINEDGVVNTADLTAFIGSFGVACDYKELHWDYRNRLILHKAVSNPTTGQVTEQHSYSYDCFGRRLTKTAWEGNATIEQRRWLVFGGARRDGRWQMLAELKPPATAEGTPTTLATFVYAGGSGGYIDDVVSMRRDLVGSGLAALPVGGQSQTTADVYFHTDDLFSVTSLTDSSGGVIERADYGDYGERLLMDAGGALVTQVDTATNRISSRVGNPWWFTGRELDQETGLYQYRYRFMNPKIGRFVSRDPIGTWGDANSLGASTQGLASNPLVMLDSFGLDAWVEKTRRVLGQHKRVCVDVWSSDCSKKTGKFCISFADGTSSGSGTCSTTTSREDDMDGDPRDDGRGVVYDDNTDNDTRFSTQSRCQDCSADKAMLRNMQDAVGRRGDYFPGVRDCRTFSDDFFADPGNDKWKVRDWTPDERRQHKAKEELDRQARERARKQWNDNPWSRSPFHGPKL